MWTAEIKPEFLSFVVMVDGLFGGHQGWIEGDVKRSSRTTLLTLLDGYHHQGVCDLHTFSSYIICLIHTENRFA